MEIKCRVLGYEEKPIAQADGTNFNWRSTLVRLESGAMVRLTTKVPLDKFVDADAELELELYGDAQLRPKVRVVGAI